MADTNRRVRKSFLWVENDVFDYYANQLSPSVFMLYLCFCRMANNTTQSCYPSQEHLAKMIGISSRSVRDNIETLIEVGLIERRKNGRGYEYCLMSIPENFSGVLKPNRKNEAPTPEVSCQNTGSQLPTNKTNNNTQEQDSFSLDPPSSDRVPTTESKPKKKTSTADPRTVEFRNALEAGYARRGWRFTWGPQDSAQLKAFLARNRSLDVKEFRKWVKNYFESEGVIPGAMVYTYLAKLPNYWAGPLNQYGKLQDCAPAEVQA